MNIYKDFERYLYTRELSEGTVRTYCRVAKHIEDYIAANYGLCFADHLDQIKGYMISNWATSIMELKVATRNNYIVSANVFLRFLYTMQYISFDLASALPPAPNIEKHRRLHPDEDSVKSGYSMQEISAMFANINASSFSGSRARALIALLVTTGLRVSEAASLNVSDPFDPSGFMLVARKGTHGNKVKVPIPQETLAYLQDYLEIRKSCGIATEPDSPLFVTKAGRRMIRGEIYKALKTVQQRVGVHTGVHTYRHTALTQIAKSADPVVARDVAGQKSIEVTNRYLHSTDQELKDAASALTALLK